VHPKTSSLGRENLGKPRGPKSSPPPDGWTLSSREKPLKRGPRHLKKGLHRKINSWKKAQSALEGKGITQRGKAPALGTTFVGPKNQVTDRWPK